MELVKIAKDVYACMQEDKGWGWNNAGFVNIGGGLAIDTLYDLPSTEKMIGLYREVTKKPMKYLVNTHHNGDHTWGNQLFSDSEIIAHKNCGEEMENEIQPSTLEAIRSAGEIPPGLKWFADDVSQFDFSGIELTLPDRTIDDRLELDLDGSPCHLISVAPAHCASDLIVHLPEQRVVFGGDVVWDKCTPIGWEGTNKAWMDALDLIISFEPEVIVPGHGPLCGINEVKELKLYFDYIYGEARRYFDEGLSYFEAAKKIEPGRFADWTQPERMIINIARAYREFREEPWDADIDRITLISQGAELRAYWESGGK